MTTIRITTSGPVFDGRASAAVSAFVNDATRETAQVGVNDVHAELGRVLRNPTGYYEGRIVTERARGGWVVHDSGVIYGPWLEGVGSRNRTTRFKGYFTFRRVAQALDVKAVPIAERVLRRFLGRMQ